MCIPLNKIEKKIHNKSTGNKLAFIPMEHPPPQIYTFNS